MSFGQRTQLVIPIGLQSVGDQAIGGIHTHVAALRQFGFITGALDSFLSQTVSIIQPRLQLLLNCERHLQRQRRHGLHQQFGDGFVDMLTGNALAHRLPLLDRFPLTHIIRHAPPISIVVADTHPTPTDGAEDDALQ